MATETAKRKQTMGVLDQLRAEGMPAKVRAKAQYKNEWTGEELPPEEEGAQGEFDADRARRVEQSMVNTMPEGPYKEVYGAVQGVTGGVQPGATGMGALTAAEGAQGMTPYSPEEFERRSSFGPTGSGGPIKTGVEALDQPVAKSKRKKKTDDESSDEPAQVNAAP